MSVVKVTALQLDILGHLKGLCGKTISPTDLGRVYKHGSGWASARLKSLVTKGLVDREESPGRGAMKRVVYSITELGKNVLAQESRVSGK